MTIGDSRPPTVVSIVGKGRSGTTLLDTILGSLPGFFSLGEVWRWETFEPFDEHRCGCGAPIDDCPVWGPVLERVVEKHPCGSDVWRESLRWERSVASWNRIPRLLAIRTAADGAWSELRELVRYASLLYHSVAERTGADVLVDSSNWPANPVALGLVPGVDVVVVQLVRDPRAVAHSWQRTKSLADGRGQMPRRRPLQSAVSWVARNLLSEVVRHRQQGASVLVSYERLVRDPSGALTEIARLARTGEEAARSIDGATVELPPNHTVAGNPSRFESGRIELRLDAAWRHQQPLSERLLVTGATLPLLLRYGYSLSGRRGPASP